MYDYIVAHTSFLGHTGYANHAREFFTELNKLIPVRVRNFCHVENLDYLTKTQKDMIIHQTWIGPPFEVGTPFNPKPTDKILNIVLVETNHFYFFDKYNGPTIAFNVWESTRQPENFFELLKSYDRFWTPTTWQTQCSIEQGYPKENIATIPEGVDGKIFKPLENPVKLNKFRFMMFGRWDYRKYSMETVKAFVEEFGNNPNVELVLSVDNPFPVDGMNSTEERLKHYGWDKIKNIKIVHFPPTNQYIKYLQEGNVLLSPSRSEGWNLPLIEALACGTPAITINWGAVLDFAKAALKVDVKELKPPIHVFNQENVPGLWAEPDFDDLKIKMRDVYENYADWKELTEENSSALRSNFSWPEAARKAFEDIRDNMPSEKYYPTKLNIGSGEYPKAGYVNVDNDWNADVKASADNLPYENENVIEVTSSHVLEHFNKYDVPKVLAEWFRVLKYNGKLSIEVPNFEFCVKKWLDESDKYGFTMDTIFGLQTREGEQHKIGFTKEKLKEYVYQAGFSDITIKDVWSHEQECFQLEAIKKKIEYNDDIFIVDCYPNSEEKLNLLKNTIQKVKKTGKPIALVSHMIVPIDVQESVDYFIYDKQNKLSENYSLNFWLIMHKSIKVVTHLDKNYHGLSVLSSMKNASTFLRNKYQYAHWIEYDMDADLDKYLQKSYDKRREEKKFITFCYHWDIPKQDGVITNLFSYDIKWLDDNLPEYNGWSEYVNQSDFMAKEIGKQSDVILEHWLYNYFIWKKFDKEIYWFTKEEKDSIIINGNILDQCDEEPDLFLRVSETQDGGLIAFIIKDGREGNVGKFKLLHEGSVYESEIQAGTLKWYPIVKKGTLYFETNTGYTKEITIDPNKTYNDTVFRFYNDEYKCINWNPADDKDFITSTESVTKDKIIYSFIDGAKVEIIGSSNEDYHVKFIDDDTGLVKFETTIKPNHWCAPSHRFFINWKITIENNGKICSEHIFDLKGKIVHVQLDSTAMGDTIAWMPYVEEFRKKHNCTMYISTFINSLFEKEYPQLAFVKPDEKIVGTYAYYTIGTRDDDYNSNKNHWKTVPLQKVASDYLGLEYTEIRPKIFTGNMERPLKQKYVCITEHSTVQCKYWIYPNGWQHIIDFLNIKGYKVVVVSTQNTNLKNVVRCINKPLEEAINYIKYCDFFIGISTGPTWLAWAMNIPTVLISGYSAIWGEMKDCIRITSPDGKCKGCFNDKDVFFDRGNWNWCPRSKNMECTTSITSEHVLKSIQPLYK